MTPDAEDAEAVEPRCSSDVVMPGMERAASPLDDLGSFWVAEEGEERPFEGGSERELDDDEFGRGVRCWL